MWSSFFQKRESATLWASVFLILWSSVRPAYFAQQDSSPSPDASSQSQAIRPPVSSPSEILIRNRQNLPTGLAASLAFAAEGVVVLPQLDQGRAFSSYCDCGRSSLSFPAVFQRPPPELHS